jgi:VWFA-related protein
MARRRPVRTYLHLFVAVLVALSVYARAQDDRTNAPATPAAPQPAQRGRVYTETRPPQGQTPTLQPTNDEAAPARTVEDETDVERVETDLTNVLLTAIDRDRRLVTTLRPEDIRVLENNEPQQVFAFQRETDLPVSLAILVDTSASQQRVLTDEQAAARAFIDSVLRPEKDTAAVVSFNGEATPVQPLTNDASRLRAAIDSVRVELPPHDPGCEEDITIERDARCWTGAWDAVWATVNEILSHTPERTRRAVVLLSDGDDTSSITKKDALIDFALKHNVAIYSIGIRDEDFPGGSLDRDALRKISERTAGRAFFPRNRAELDAAFAQINQELRSQYLLSYAPSNKRRDGTFRQIKIEITNPALRKDKLRLVYRQGYYARTTTTANTSAPPAKK